MNLKMNLNDEDPHEAIVFLLKTWYLMKILRDTKVPIKLENRTKGSKIRGSKIEFKSPTCTFA